MTELEALFLLHTDLPREGPGSDEATREAIQRLPAMPSSPRVIDLGCGPGKQSLVLADHFRSTVTALDFHAPYLERLRQSAAAQGIIEFIDTRHGRMEELEELPGSVDLIWSEGAIYNVGFTAGLQLWRPLLRDAGCVVASEATWFTDSPPEEIQAYWRDEYPAMTTIQGNIKHVVESGYDVLDHFRLPTSAWWDEYYTPLAERVAQLRVSDCIDSVLSDALDEADREMEMHSKYSDDYGYIFYLMQKTSG